MKTLSLITLLLIPAFSCCKDQPSTNSFSSKSSSSKSNSTAVTSKSAPTGSPQKPKDIFTFEVVTETKTTITPPVIQSTVTAHPSKPVSAATKALIEKANKEDLPVIEIPDDGE